MSCASTTCIQTKEFDGDLESLTVSESLKKNIRNNFLQQNLASYRSNLQLKHVLLYINCFCIFCGGFLLKLLVKRKDPIPPLRPTELRQDSQYQFSFDLKQDLDEDLFIYYQLEDFSQNALRIPNSIGNKPIPFKEAISSPLGSRYIWIDIVKFVKTDEQENDAPIALEFPPTTNKYGRVQVVPPEENEHSFTEDAKYPKWYRQDNCERFKREHFVRFCQWLFTSPLGTTAKVIRKVKGGLKAGKYSIVFYMENLPLGCIENLEFFIKPKSKVRVKNETKKYLIVMIATSLVSQVFVLLLRFFFPKPQRERDLVEGYRMKMERFRIG